MIKNIINIFLRDLKVNTRDFLALYIILAPILFGVLINVFTPGINDTTVNLALLETDIEYVEYLEDFARIETFKSIEAVENRVSKRDHIIGILPENNEYYLLVQGNESESIIEYGKLLKTFFELDSRLEDTTAKLMSFERVVPPIKKIFTNAVILLISVLGGMLIAFNVIEEKVDKTIDAVHVTTVSNLGFILGKSISGLIVPIFGTVVVLIITGFGNVNMLQVIVVVVSTALMSLLLGFIEGINNDDVMSAAATLKLLFLPIMGSVVAIELLGDKWQKFFYWIPYYWGYKANDLIMSYSNDWTAILQYTGILVVIVSIIFALLVPKIRKGLK